MWISLKDVSGAKTAPNPNSPLRDVSGAKTAPNPNSPLRHVSRAKTAPKPNSYLRDVSRARALFLYGNFWIFLRGALGLHGISRPTKTPN